MTVTPARPAPTGCPAYSATYPSVFRSVTDARALARDAFGAWGLDRLGGSAELVLSELVTNAVRHARGTAVRVVVDRPQEGWVQVGVTDRDPMKLPALPRPGLVQESGYGLLLVDHECERWGYVFLGSGARVWGKRVWAQWRTEGEINPQLPSRAGDAPKATR